MGFVIALDTGRNMGWALGHEKTLLGCGLLSLSPHTPIILPRYSGVAHIEIPEWRPGNEKSPDKILVLARRAGRAEEWALSAGYSVVTHRPSEWKGNVPKEIHNRRTLGKLTPNERSIVENMCSTLAKVDDVLDAVGLFLFAVGRNPNRGTHNEA